MSAFPEEDFDEIRWVWHDEDRAKQHLNEWIQMKKLTSRLEDLVPGEWFNAKWKEWQKDGGLRDIQRQMFCVVQSYQAKQNVYKAEAKKNSTEVGKDVDEEKGRAGTLGQKIPT
eukprot:s4413_g5.t1